MLLLLIHCLLFLCEGFVYDPKFYDVILNDPSSLAIILLRNKELVALPSCCPCCYVDANVLCLFFVVHFVGLCYVIA